MFRKVLLIICTFFLATLAVAFLPSASQAQQDPPAIYQVQQDTPQPDGHFGHGHDYWHGDFYEKLVTPETKVSCCNLADCRPTTGRQLKQVQMIPVGPVSFPANYEVKINGTWTPVLNSKVVKVSAPDQGFHVCAPHNFSGKPEHVYCVVLPPES